MSARHLQARKPIPSEEYKRVGVIILTTLAVNKAPGQSIDVSELTSTGDSKCTGSDRSAQQLGTNTESDTASAPQLEGPSSCPSGSIEDVMLEVIPITEQNRGVRKNPVLLEDGAHSLDDGVESSQELHPKASPALPDVPVGLDESTPAGSTVNPISKCLSEKGICNGFREAALRPLPISQGQSEGEGSRAKKSVKLDIPPFLHPTNQVGNPNVKALHNISALDGADKPEQALAVTRIQFSEGEFEKHLFSYLRQRMFFWSNQPPIYGDKGISGSLLECYLQGLKEWCASVFDASVRRVKFAIDPVKIGLSWNDPITGEMKCHSDVDILRDLEEEIVQARQWLQDYLRAEPEFSKAVNKLKSNHSKTAKKSWTAYKKKHSLTSSSVKTRLDRPHRSATYLLKNTHFLSWFMRSVTPACFLFTRRHMIKAIRAIEGDTSMLANVLENLCVQDLAAFRKTRRMLEEERFQSYVKVPQDVEGVL
eukprot:Blabericola_migrator_1__6359@NODE_3207_length_1949_cov_31_728480_g2007_i0_p1_GENE_NODE_3207_length_1949_cov_31_728480_g2007_i0NODE_3207_length_1949_cov_31_728480_g2007_i0_p1_ORF_typecomplete_len481_score70_40GrpB/PF04229_14/0_14PspA_IM30/PF04012_12/0_18MHB/PF16525_5/0_36_NODE_3207_length_1949_cov_31_728480_g2007_i03151757